MADIIVVKQNVAEKVAVNPAPVTITGVTLVPANSTTLGGIIVGDNLSITGNGVLSAQPGGVTGFNGRTGNVSLTSNDVTTALTYTPLTSTTPYGNMSFTGTSADSPFNLKLSNSNGSRYVGIASGGSNYTYGNGTVVPQASTLDFNWVINNPRTNGQTDTYYPFFRLWTDRSFPDINEAYLAFQYNYTPNATSGPYYNSSLRVYKTKLEFYASSYTWTDNSLVTRLYADSRYLTSANLTPYLTISAAAATYLTSANLTFANLTGTPTTLAGYGITDGLTSANLTPYLTISSANATYSVLGHTHAIANVTGLQTALDAKLPSANFTYANITGKPTLATVATSGSYTDLSNTPAAYSLPTATTSVLGGVKVDGSSIVINSGVISSTYSYTLPAATVSTLGGVRLGTGVGLDANGFLTTDVKLSTNTFTGTQALGGNLITQPKLQAYRETSTAPTISSGTLTLDLSGSNFFAVSLNAAITTLTISNVPSSSVASFTLEFTGTGTTYSVNWALASGTIKWAGAASAPTVTATTGKKDVFCFYTTDGGSNWLGFIGGQNY